MNWKSAVAIYVLFWVMSAFMVMPFGMKTHDEAGIPRIRGQAESAPADFRLGRTALRTTIVGTVLFTLFYANFIYGWVSADSLTFFRPPA